MVRVKICGMTNPEDALAAVDFGADAIGFIFYPPSPRFIEPELAEQIVKHLPPFVTTVGVFVKKPIEEIKDIVNQVGLDVVQLHGDEPPEVCSAFQRVIKVIRVRGMEDVTALDQYQVSAFLLDTYAENAYGGTGTGFNWLVAEKAKQFGRIIMAGGLTPDNVSEVVQQVRPYGVDAVSGVESKVKGKKDLVKMKAFIKKAKGLN